MLPEEWVPYPQNRKHIIPWLLKVRTANSAYRSLFVADRQGKVIFAIQSGPPLSDVSREQFFRTALSGKSYISEIRFDARSGRPTVLLAAPLPNSFETTGVLAAIVDLSVLQEELGDLSLGKTGQAAIVTSKRQIIAFSGRRHPYGRQDILRLLSAPQGKLLEYRDQTGNVAIGIHRLLPELNASLVVRQDARETFAAVGRLTWLLVLGLCAGLVAVSGLGAALASHFCRPLADLREAAQGFADGERSRRAPESGPEEMRTLASTFNSMVERLQRSQESLERHNRELSELTQRLDVLHRIDSRLLSAMSLDEALATTVSSATEIGCPRAAVFTMKRDRYELVCSAVQGLSVASIEQAKGCIPEVWNAGVALRAADPGRGSKWTLLPILTPVGTAGRGCEHGRCRLERARLPRPHQLRLSSMPDVGLLQALAESATTILCKPCVECEFREVWGVLAAQSPRGREPALVSVARQAALAIAHASKFEEASAEIRHRIRQLEVLCDIARVLSSTLRQDEVLSLVVEKAVSFLGASHGSILLFSDPPGQNGAFRRVAHGGEEIDGSDAWIDDLHIEIATRLSEGEEPVLLTSGDELAIDERAREKLCCVLGVPLRVGSKLIGCLVVINIAGGHVCTARDSDFMQALAGYAAAAIENARLYEAERRGREQASAATEQKDRLLAQLFRAQEDERRRVAMDLHDGPTQKVSAAALALETARELLRERPQMAIAQIRTTEDVLRRAVDEMRELVQNLRPTALDDMGLATAVAQQVREVALAAGIEAHFSVQGENGSMDPQTAAAVFRVAQEALANVRKHAQARNLWVEMKMLDSALELVIRDDGRGFVVEDGGDPSGRHFGLMGMRERMEMVGGSLSIESEPGAGTTVMLSVPANGQRGAKW